MSRNQYDDLERQTLDPDDDEAEQEKPAPRKRVSRLPSLPGPFVRVPIGWLKPAPDKFDPADRLFLLVLYKSYWGQIGVKLTSAVAAEIGMSTRAKNRALQMLERKGRVRVERKGRSAAVVWPTVLS